MQAQRHPTSPALWRYVMPLVEARCMAWEMVGYGESIPQGAGRDISVGRQADYLLDWLDAVGIDRAALSGTILEAEYCKLPPIVSPIDSRRWL